MEISEKRCWKGYKPTLGKKPYSKGSCMRESYKLIGKVLLEAGYKGIQFNRFGTDSAVFPAKMRPHGKLSDIDLMGKKKEMYSRDDKNLQRVSSDQAERILDRPYHKDKIKTKSPEEAEEYKKAIGRRVHSDYANAATDLEKEVSKSSELSKRPRFYGFATRGPKGEAFIGRPQRSRIDPETRKAVEMPYDRKTRQSQREVIGHEAAHVRMSRLPGILSKLAGSETLASAYGGWKAPVRGSSVLSRLGAAAKRVGLYGLPTDIGNAGKNLMRRFLPSRYREFQAESYKLIGKIIAEAGKGVMPKMKMGVHKSRAGGLTQKGVEAYRRANPGSKLKTAVTTKPSKLKKGSKSAKRRKSFCARMSGMRKRQKASNNTGKDRLSLSLKKWNC